jgi:hypothetical protein
MVHRSHKKLCSKIYSSENLRPRSIFERKWRNWKIIDYKNSQIIYDENCLIFLLLSIFATNPWKNWEPKAKVVFARLQSTQPWEIGLGRRGANRETAWENSPNWAHFCELSDGVWLSTNATVQCTCPLLEVTVLLTAEQPSQVRRYGKPFANFNF